MNDLNGKIFGRLTVIGYDRKQPFCKYWLCECICGNKTSASEKQLINGKKLSCGCYHMDVLRQPKKSNRYEFVDDYVVGYTDKDETFYFDKDDYNLITRINGYWFIEDGYVRIRKTYNNKRKRISMHKLILGASEDQMVDHKNGIRYDNRKSNLRFCNKSQNSINVSKITGVYSYKNNKWIANIRYRGKTYHLGIFNSYEDAVAARKKAEIEFFGEFSRIDKFDKIDVL